MRTESLPALNTKKEPNIIKVTNTKMEGVNVGSFENNVTVSKPDSGKGVVIEIPAESFVFNQFDSLNEFIADCGGEEKALEIANAFKRNDSLDGGKVLIRTSTSNKINEVVKAALHKVANHTFVESEISAAKAKEELNQLKANVATMSDAEIAAYVRRMTGITS